MTPQAHTAFANGMNAWTGQRQTTPRKTMKKPVSGVDGLTVDHDIPLPEHKVMPGNKYGGVSTADANRKSFTHGGLIAA